MLLNLQQILNFDPCWIFLITWISILLMIYSNQWLKRINRIANYRVNSLKEGFFVALLFVLFVYYFCYLRIYRWFFEAKIINVWDIVYEIWVFFEPFNIIVISLAIIWLISCLFLFLVIMQALKLWLKKSYFVILQSKLIASFLHKYMFEKLHRPIKSYLFNLDLENVFIKKLVIHYLDHGYTFLFSTIYLFLILYDIFFHEGNLVYTISVMPYYLIATLLHSIHSFIIFKRTPSIDTVISDIYYNFDHPRKENLEIAKMCNLLYENYYKVGYYLPPEEFEKNKYYSYRIVISQPESVTGHTIYKALPENEKIRRINILKEIGAYLK